jgi:hypothetical protein
MLRQLPPVFRHVFCVAIHADKYGDIPAFGLFLPPVQPLFLPAF